MVKIMLSIYKAQTIGKQSRKYTITVNMESLFSPTGYRSLIVPSSMDNLRDDWQLFDIDPCVSDDCKEVVSDIITPMLASNSDTSELDDIITRVADEVITLKIESNLWDTIINALDNVYCNFSDQDVGSPLISDLQNWYSEGEITFYMSQKQVNEYLRLKQLSMSDFDNDTDQVNDYLQEQAEDVENLNGYDFDSSYSEWLEQKDKELIKETILCLSDEFNITLKGDTNEQLSLIA